MFVLLCTVGKNQTKNTFKLIAIFPKKSQYILVYPFRNTKWCSNARYTYAWGSFARRYYHHSHFLGRI